MTERKIQVTREGGLHASDAMLFCQAANEYESRIFIVYSTRTVNAKSLMSVLALDLEQDAEVTIQAEGKDAEAAADALTSFLQEKGTGSASSFQAIRDQYLEGTE